MRIIPRAVAIATIIVLAVPALAWAHAHLTHSTPGADARLAKAPTEIDLSFSETVLVAKTTVVLKDSTGRIAPTGKTERGSGGRSVVVKILGALKPGRYTVAWSNEALNEHPSSGTFGFRVLRPGERK
jgi:methionine-rich copper-binding protein CopC